jgi:hypothetical protein
MQKNEKTLGTFFEDMMSETVQQARALSGRRD